MIKESKIVELFLLLIYLFTGMMNSVAEALRDNIQAVYVISLDRTPDRLLFMKKQLDKLGIPFIHFSAVDGNYVTLTDIESGETFFAKDLKKLPKSKTKGRTFRVQQSAKYRSGEFYYTAKKRMLSSGECGCSMSHRAVLADIARHNYKKAIIFEDDVEFFDNFLQDAPVILRNIPRDANVLFLDVGISISPSRKTYFYSPQFWLSKFTNTNSPYYAAIKKDGTVWGTHAYCVSSESAKKLLKITERVNLPIDTAIMIHPELKLYVSKIKLLSGDALQSEIKNTRGW